MILSHNLLGSILWIFQQNLSVPRILSQISVQLNFTKFSRNLIYGYNMQVFRFNHSIRPKHLPQVIFITNFLIKIALGPQIPNHLRLTWLILHKSLLLLIIITVCSKCTQKFNPNLFWRSGFTECIFINNVLAENDNCNKAFTVSVFFFHYIVVRLVLSAYSRTIN